MSFNIDNGYVCNQPPGLAKIKTEQQKEVMKRIAGIFLMCMSLTGMVVIRDSSGYSPKDGRTDAFLQSVNRKCDDVVVIFARGSGNKLRDKDETAWRRSLDRMLSQSNLTYSFYELGTTSQKGYSYPAVAISKSVNGYVTALGAKVSSGESYKYGESVRNGSIELRLYISNMTAICPNTRYVIGGYSQGAQVITKTLLEYKNSNITYVATFGDPKLYLPEGAGLLPKACRGEVKSEYRANVADCRAYKGILGGYDPYRTRFYAGKVGAWCYRKDIMCSSRWSFADHSSYVSEKIYDEATMKIQEALKKSYPNAWNGVASWRMHDVAILIDSTGSMGWLWSRYQQKAIQLAKKVYARGGRVAVYDYQDLQDGREPEQKCDFYCSEREVVAAINGIVIGGLGGNDDPESTLSASYTVMKKLHWRIGATKSLVLVTDAGFHNPDIDGVTLKDVVQLSLEIDPVNFFVVTTNTSKYEELTDLTGGEVYSYLDVNLMEEHILTRPNPTLNNTEYTGFVGDNFYFEVNGVEARKYEWDLDGDGIYEIETTENSVQKVYDTEFQGMISVVTTDLAGRRNVATGFVEAISEEEYLANYARIKQASLEKTEEGVMLRLEGQNIWRTIVSIGGATIGYLDENVAELLIEDLQLDEPVFLAAYNHKQERGDTIALLLKSEIAVNNESINDDSEGVFAGLGSMEAESGSVLGIKNSHTSKEYKIKAPRAGVVTGRNY